MSLLIIIYTLRLAGTNSKTKNIRVKLKTSADKSIRQVIYNGDRNNLSFFIKYTYASNISLKKIRRIRNYRIEKLVFIPAR